MQIKKTRKRLKTFHRFCMRSYHKIIDGCVDSVDVLVVQIINDVRFTRYVARFARLASLSRKLW